MKVDIEAVVLDMDGLMLDTEPIYKVSWQRASAELGYPLDDLSYAQFVGRPNADCEAMLLDQFGSDFPLDTFRRRWSELWQEGAARDGIVKKPGLIEFLTFCEEQNVPIAIATSSDAAYAEFSLRQAGLAGRFSVVVTGDQVARGKPAPDIYLETARRLQVQPAQCVALEDSEAGILAASTAGMIGLLVPDQTEPTDKAVRAAFQVLSSLHEAPRVVAALWRGMGERL